MKPDHEAYISIYQGKRFAYCRCGWESGRHTTAIAAIKERDRHLDDQEDAAVRAYYLPSRGGTGCKGCSVWMPEKVSLWQFRLMAHEPTCPTIVRGEVASR